MELAHNSFNVLHGPFSGCRTQYGGHYQISFVSGSSLSNLSLSLVMSPLLSKERAWTIYISWYMLHFLWCSDVLISRDQIYIAWSCDFYDLIMWPTLYIAQSCAFNARSCYIYFLILWPISPDLVTYTARSCDLFHPVLSQIYIARTCELYHLILWPIPAMLCPMTPDLVTFIIEVLWQVSPDS